MALRTLVERFARTRGPFSTSDAAERFGLPRAPIESELQELESHGQVYRGPFSAAPSDTEWCDAQALKRIRRLSLAKARGEVSAVDGRAYARFLIGWHGVDDQGRQAFDRVEQLLNAIEQIQGVAIPASALEADVLAARVPDYRAQDLDVLVARGDVVLEGRGALGARDGKVALYLAPHRALLGHRPAPSHEGEVESRARAALASRGAIFFPEIVRTLPDVRERDLLDALWSLFWNGEITNDSVSALRARTADASSSSSRRSVAARMSRYRSRFDIPRDAVGRFSILDALPSETAETRLASIEQWLARYGVLTREAITSEAKEGGFSAVYPLLRALEERGQVRRGYFIEGLGALQFADASVVDRLREARAPGAGDSAAVLAATDPAQPFGITLPWPSWTKGEGERRARHHVVIADGELSVLFAGDGARAIVHLPESESDAAHVARLSARAIVEWMRRSAIRLIGHAPNSDPLNRGALAEALLEAGLSASGPGFRI